ncbi:hypothetical protein K438DRAFT_1755160 [Mycena galopus ATCC 62051]|nr:hypothetical protein K438DRAFT_1755160 [Mycena galopus ATCC 62051]
MFNTRALLNASLIAATMVTTALGKAQAVLYGLSDCTGDDHSGTIGMSTGVCHSTYFEYFPPEGTGNNIGGYASSVHFYTDGAVEDYYYYSDTNCNDGLGGTSRLSGCVTLTNVKSFMKAE